MYRDEDFEDEEDDWEAPEPDERDEDELDTLPCPACGRQIYEEAEACPYCGEYVTHSKSVLAGKPFWFVALAVLGIIAVIASILHWGLFLPAAG
jgi:hypothetical protein